MFQYFQYWLPPSHQSRHCLSYNWRSKPGAKHFWRYLEILKDTWCNLVLQSPLVQIGSNTDVAFSSKL